MQAFVDYLDATIVDAVNARNEAQETINFIEDGLQIDVEEKIRANRNFIVVILGIVRTIAKNFRHEMLSGDLSNTKDRFVGLLDVADNDRPLYGAAAWKIENGYMEQEFDENGEPVFETRADYKGLYDELWDVFSTVDRYIAHFASLQVDENGRRYREDGGCRIYED